MGRSGMFDEQRERILAGDGGADPYGTYEDGPDPVDLLPEADRDRVLRGHEVATYGRVIKECRDGKRRFTSACGDPDCHACSWLPFDPSSPFNVTSSRPGHVGPMSACNEAISANSQHAHGRKER